MVALRSPIGLGVGSAFVAAGVVVLALAFTGPEEALGPAAMTESSSGATTEPEGGWSQSLGVAGGILVAAGIGVALLAFSDLGRPSRR